MIPIDENVPMPEPKVGGRVKKYPFEDMKVGDSFWCERGAHSMNSYHYQLRQRTGMKFKSEEEIQDGIRGSRTWRTA